MNQKTLIINGMLQQINEDAIETLENLGYPYEKAVHMISEVDMADIVEMCMKDAEEPF